MLANTETIRAILPALTMMSNPFQSASSLTSTEATVQASDFKSKLLQYYFAPRPPPGLLLLSSQVQQSYSKMTCMVSKLVLSSDLIEAAHILPKASSHVRLVSPFECQALHNILPMLLCSGAAVLLEFLMYGMSAMVFSGHSHSRRCVISW